MKGLTIEDLKKWCDSAVKQGFGDRLILVAGDEEGNSYHALYHGLSIPTKELFTDNYAPMLCANVEPSEVNEKTLILE